MQQSTQEDETKTDILASGSAISSILKRKASREDLKRFLDASLQTSANPTNGQNTSSPSLPLSKCRRTDVSLDANAFHVRLGTFQPLRWPSHGPVTPPDCARFGWECVGVDLLRCVSCRATLSGKLASSSDPTVFKASVDRLRSKLKDSHAKYCTWGWLVSPPHFCQLSEADSSARAGPDQLMTRASALVQELGSERVPKIATAFIRKLNPSQLEVLQNLLDCGGSETEDGVMKNALLIVLTGWSARSGGGAKLPILTCHFCNKRCPMWIYKPRDGSDTEEEPELTEEELYDLAEEVAQEVSNEVLVEEISNAAVASIDEATQADKKVAVASEHNVESQEKHGESFKDRSSPDDSAHESSGSNDSDWNNGECSSLVIDTGCGKREDNVHGQLSDEVMQERYEAKVKKHHDDIIDVKGNDSVTDQASCDMSGQDDQGATTDSFGDSFDRKIKRESLKEDHDASTVDECEEKEEEDYSEEEESAEEIDRGKNDLDEQIKTTAGHDTTSTAPESDELDETEEDNAKSCSTPDLSRVIARDKKIEGCAYETSFDASLSQSSKVEEEYGSRSDSEDAPNTSIVEERKHEGQSDSDEGGRVRNERDGEIEEVNDEDSEPNHSHETPAPSEPVGFLQSEKESTFAESDGSPRSRSNGSSSAREPSECNESNDTGHMDEPEVEEYVGGPSCIEEEENQIEEEESGGSLVEQEDPHEIDNFDDDDEDLEGDDEESYNEDIEDEEMARHGSRAEKMSNGSSVIEIVSSDEEEAAPQAPDHDGDYDDDSKIEPAEEQDGLKSHDVPNLDGQFDLPIFGRKKQKSFNPTDEHLPWCCWVTPTDTGELGWQKLFLKLSMHNADLKQITTRPEQRLEARVDGQAGLELVRSVFGDTV